MGKTYIAYIAYIAIVAKAPRLRALPAASQHCGAPHLSGPAAGGHAAADPTKLGFSMSHAAKTRKMSRERDGK